MPRACPACRGQRLDVISAEQSYAYEQAGVTNTWRYRWVRCASCGLSGLDPQPSWSLLRSFAQAGQWGSWFEPSALRPPLSRSLARAKWKRLTFARLVRVGAAYMRSCLGSGFAVVSWVLVQPLPKDAVIFDLGCGDGAWLWALRYGGFRRLYGHVVACAPERLAELRKHGIAVTDGSFLNQEYPSASYDCIRIRDALAGVIDPDAVVRQCLRMLKPSGVLIVHVPESEAGWSCTKHAGAALPDDPPCHVYHHTERSLRSLLSATGFRDLQALTLRNSSKLSAICNGMRRQAGKAVLPVLASWALGPVYQLTRVWAEQRHGITLVAREPALRVDRSTNGHARGLRQALFTRS